MTKKNPFEPIQAELKEIKKETSSVKTFKLELEEIIEYQFGHFIMLTVPGVGEIPVFVSSDYGSSSSLEITVKKTGVVTGYLHSKKKGDMLAVRGPYGRRLKVDELKNRELLIIASDIGFAGIRPLIYKITKERNDYPKSILLYECDTAEDMIYKEEYVKWIHEIEMHRIVKKPAPDWKEEVGSAAELINKIEINTENCAAVIAMPFIVAEESVVPALRKKGVSEKNILIYLQSRMTCGFGKCRRCITGGWYVCKDGPVFSYEKMKSKARE